MNHRPIYRNTVEDAVNGIVNYFLENAEQNYATAVRNAAGQVIAYSNGNTSQLRFSRNVNRNLCEALFFMNSDPNCDPKQLVLTRKLLESYREMNGLPTDDFEGELQPMALEIEVPDTVEIDEPYNPAPAAGDNGYGCMASGGEDCEWMPDCGQEEDEILNAVNVGETLDISDYCAGKFGDEDFRSRLTNEDEILDAVKSLIRAGVLEVVERDEFNGKITSVIRVR